MKHSVFRVGLFGVIAGLTSGLALAESSDYGKHVYDSNCATCHGLTGKGDGPMKAYLKVAPTDLTTIAKKNSGVLPLERLSEVMDGRREVALHGARDMPVWGQDFRANIGTNWPIYMDAPFNPEIFIRGRIMALMDYIVRLQER